MYATFMSSKLEYSGEKCCENNASRGKCYTPVTGLCKPGISHSDGKLSLTQTSTVHLTYKFKCLLTSSGVQNLVG